MEGGRSEDKEEGEQTSVEWYDFIINIVASRGEVINYFYLATSTWVQIELSNTF